MKWMSGSKAAVVGISVGAFVICTGAMVTHLVWIIKALASDAGATAGQIVLGLMGAFIPPVGVIHGFILWFS